MTLAESAKALGNCALFFGQFLEEARPDEIQLLGELLHEWGDCGGGVRPLNTLFAVISETQR